MAQRVRITFRPQIPQQDRDMFAVVLELFGTVYKSQNPDEIIILPKDRAAADLKAQLTVWQEDGHLSWSDAT
jgi:hypothetical protein